MFSRRTAWDMDQDPLAAALALRKQAGRIVFDLTTSNPTVAGFSYPDAAIAQTFAAGAVLPYRPDPIGLAAARQAVSGYYAQRHGATVAPGRLVLASGTSELYSYAFRLLCDPGDNILIARPSYPLFEYLAAMDTVELRPFPLAYESGWHLDRRAVEQACTANTRAIAVIHPNNPTGHFTSQADRQWLVEFCTARGLALLVDEVFLDYPLEAAQNTRDTHSFLAAETGCLTLVMSGLSKVAGLPQMKLAWMAVTGPAALCEAAMARIEVIADSFLSVSTPVQHAAAALLGVADSLQPQIHARLRANLSFLDEILARYPATQRLIVEGGWYAILRFPAVAPSGDLAFRLLGDAGVHLHPGGFFGLPESGYLVCSLLVPAEDFASGLHAALPHLQSS